MTPVNLKNPNSITGSIIMIVLAMVAGLVLYILLMVFIRRWTNKRTFTKNRLKLENRHLVGPLLALLPVICLQVIVPFIPIAKNILVIIDHILSLWFIAAVAWLMTKTIYMFTEILISHAKIEQKDNLKARQLETQLITIRRVIDVVITFIAVSIMLLTFDQIRKVGISLLASAGAVGVIMGFAAQKTLGNLFAGIQIAIAQPIRIDDVVIVENEWGWIEEITLTYVVVRIWDLRRLIVPISYFLEKPFQNWTRTSADLLGSVYIYVDYTIPVRQIRDQVKVILDSSIKWDRKVWSLQVTDAGRQTLELRALMSAPDSSTAWDLRCEVREKLIGYLQENFPHSLPRTRVMLEQRANSESDERSG
jgi:small-conductance mechanosensitive channel